MSISERRQREIEELRNTILAHATQIIAQDGYSGFSIRRLALSIDYSPRTIYLYFKDKEAILLALVEEAYAQTLLHRESHLLSLNPIERVRIQLRNHFHNALAHPEHYRVIVDILNRDGFIPGPRQLELESLVRQDIAFIKTWNPDYLLDVALHALFATIRGLSMHLVTHRDRYGTKQLASMIETYVDWITNWLSD
jgi:AcrR family transcriptional regulator